MSTYQKTLQSSPLFKKIKFGNIFSPTFDTKSGYIGLKNGQFIFLETLPYYTKNDYMIFKSSRVKYLITLDTLARRRFNLLTSTYSQIHTLATKFKPPEKPDVATAQFALKANVASTAKFTHQPRLLQSTQNPADVVSQHPRLRRSIFDYFFGVSASQVEDEMNTHFADLTKNIENEFSLERTISNKIINLLNEEEAELNDLKQNQNRLIQKINLDLLFDNKNLLEKYSFFAQKNNIVINHLLTSYEKILEILVKTIRPSDKNIQCGFSVAFGENASCLDLRNSFVEEDDKHFHVFLEAFPLIYDTYYKVTCEIEENSTVINNLHMKLLHLTDLSNTTSTQQFRLLQKTDLVDNTFLIVTKGTEHGLSCKKSTILFVNQKEIFCTTKVREFFSDISSIRYEQGGRNLIHSLSDKILLNNSLPGLDLTLFNKLNFDNVTSRLNTMKDYIKHNFHPIKRYKENPVELVYHLVGTVLVVLVIAIVVLLVYCCVKNIIIPATQNSACCRRLHLPGSIQFRNRTSIETSQTIDSENQVSATLHNQSTAASLNTSQSPTDVPVRPSRRRDNTQSSQNQSGQHILGQAFDLQPRSTSTQSRRHFLASSVVEEPQTGNADQPPSYASSVHVTRSGRPRVSVNANTYTLPRRNQSARQNTPLNDIFGTSGNL